MVEFFIWVRIYGKILRVVDFLSVVFAEDQHKWVIVECGHC
jgi:hypothetical protein